MAGERVAVAFEPDSRQAALDPFPDCVVVALYVESQLVNAADGGTLEQVADQRCGHAEAPVIIGYHDTEFEDPNPTVAYSEAIKAVETACIPVVIPGAQGAKATLGKVIIALNHHQQDWQLTIHSSGAPADISPLLAMLRLLWQGQTDRHGGSTPTIPVTTQAAEAAVHLAVTLVQWFQSGAIQRVGSP